MTQGPVEKEKDFLRRVARAVRAGVRGSVLSQIRTEMRWAGDLNLSPEGVLAMRNAKNDVFKVNAFTGETTHPNYLSKLSAKMMVSGEFRNITKPQLNASLYSLAVGVYEIPSEGGHKHIRVNRSVSGQEMLESFMKDPEAADPLMGIDMEKLTAPDGPAEPYEIPQIVRWNADDLRESQAVLEAQKPKIEDPDFETWML